MTLAIVASNATLLDFQAAIAKAEGLPRRGVVFGGPDYLPQAYAPGAAGWTDQVSSVIDTNDGKRALEIAPEFRRHLGKTVRVGAKDITLPAPGTLVNVTRKPASGGFPS